MMSTIATTTAEQLAEMPKSGHRVELIAGEIRMMSPSGWKHGRIVSKLSRLLGNHIEESQLGETFGAETGFLIARSPDTVRAPDVAFVANESLPASEPEGAYWPGAPDLAVEVLSPSDRTGDVDEKIQAWLSAGSRAVWVVDPKLQTVTIYHSATDVRIFTASDTLEDESVVTGFRCEVAEVFGKR